MILRPFLCALLLCAATLPAANLAVNLSGTTNPAFSNKLTDTDVQVARFVLQASGGDVGVSSITVTVSNPTHAVNAFTGMRLFYDTDGNGSFDPTEELSTVQTVAGATVTFAEAFTALNGLIRELQVRVNIGANPTVYGEAFVFSINASTDIVLPGAPTDTVSGTFPVSSFSLTIRNSTNQLVPGTGNPAAPRTVSLGAQNVSGVHFAIDSLTPVTPGELVGIDLQAVAISVTTQTAGQASAVSGVSLWQDDGDNLFEPSAGEVLILARTPADLGKWTPTGNVITVTFDGTAISTLPQINTGQARTFWVSISFAAGAACVCEVSVNRTNIQGSLGVAADFFVNSPASITGNVITVTTPPPEPAPDEAEGEGGCSTNAEPMSWLSALLLVAAGFASVVRVAKRKLSSRITT